MVNPSFDYVYVIGSPTDSTLCDVPLGAYVTLLNSYTSIT